MNFLLTFSFLALQVLKLSAELGIQIKKLKDSVEGLRDFEIGEISQVKAQDCERDEAAVAFGHKQ